MARVAVARDARAATAAAQSVTNEQLAEGLGRSHERGSTTAATTAASGTVRSRRSRRPTSASCRRSGRFRPASLGKFETTPLVLDGLMYITGPEQHRLGDRCAHRPADLELPPRPARRAQHLLRPRQPRLRGARQPPLHEHARRAPARLRHEDRRDRLGLGDRRLQAAATARPRRRSIVKDKVVVGIAGAEYGIRGFIDAFDAATGKRAWRFWTVPGPGEKGSETWEGDSWKRGGGSTWVTGTLRSGAQPDLLGHRQSRARSLRQGSRRRQPLHRLGRRARRRHRHAQVALPVHAARHARLGRRRRCRCWPTSTINGVPRKTLLFANRNGFFYTLDRTNGELHHVAVVRQDDVGREDRRRRPARREAQHRSDRGRHRGVPRHHRRHQLPCRRPSTRRPACST